jgi:hypothetical protein
MRKERTYVPPIGRIESVFISAGLGAWPISHLGGVMTSGSHPLGLEAAEQRRLTRLCVGWPERPESGWLEELRFG